jgi:hypothetical protein
MKSYNELTKEQQERAAVQVSLINEELIEDQQEPTARVEDYQYDFDIDNHITTMQ